jgi:hypothetical protein
VRKGKVVQWDQEHFFVSDDAEIGQAIRWELANKQTLASIVRLGESPMLAAAAHCRRFSEAARCLKWRGTFFAFGNNPNFGA